MSDRRAVWLQYRHPKGIEERIVNHLCAPGLGAAVRRYVDDTYGRWPEATARYRYGNFDPGGMLLNCDDKPIQVQLRGWKMRIMPTKVPVACAMIEDRLKKPPKMYGRYETYRWNQMYGLLVLTREDAEMFLEGLKPYREREALRRDAALQQLAGHKNVRVNGARRPLET